MHDYKIKLLQFALIISLLSGSVYANDFKQHFDLAQNYLSHYQYSGAITEFKSALSINYMDKSALIGLINSYFSRAKQYVDKDGAWDKAADDYRSALFYLKMFSNDSIVKSNSSAVVQATANLDKCLSVIGFNKSPENRYNTAKKLRAEGNFAAAGYEFEQALGAQSLQKISFEQIAGIMKALKNLPKAAEYYQKAVYIDPTDLALRLDYAKVLDLTKKNDEALKQYSYVLDRVSSDNKDILYVLERTFKTKLEANPKNADLNADLGAVLQKEGRYDEALTYYKQAELLDYTNLNTRINVGTLYQEKGDYRTAIEAYKSVLILAPNNVKALFLKGQCHEKLGDTKLAQELYNQVTALDPNNEYVRYQMLETKKKTLNIAQYIDYVKTNYKSSEVSGILYDYAFDLHKKNKTDDAITLYKAAIAAAGKNADSNMYVNLALAEAQRENFDEALNILTTAKVKFPNNSGISSEINKISSMKTDTLISKAAKYYEGKDYKNAISSYLNIYPPTADTMLGVAASYQEMNDVDNAITYYKKALELKPVSSDIAYAIATLYGEKEDYNNAKDYLNKAIAIDKNNTQAIEYLKSINDMEKANFLNEAIAKYDANNYDESLNDFNKILKSDPTNSYALYYRGMIYDSKGKRNEAIADLQKAYSINSDFTICNYLIASNYDTLGKYKEAYQYYTTYANSNVDDDEYKKYAKDRAEELKEYAAK